MVEVMNGTVRLEGGLVIFGLHLECVRVVGGCICKWAHVSDMAIL